MSIQYPISTHSLTKRLTLSGQGSGSRKMHFNSQPHEEADEVRSFSSGWGSHFNSQPHEEADRHWRKPDRQSDYFNSQPHEEADLVKAQALDYLFKFQLTASRRGWLLKTCSIFDLKLFQLTASRRGWRADWYLQSIYRNFNSQPHEEADTINNLGITDGTIISTHSLTKRLTTSCTGKVTGRSAFQLTASRRGWHFRNLRTNIVPKISTHSLTKRLTVELWVPWTKL